MKLVFILRGHSDNARLDLYKNTSMRPPFAPEIILGLLETMSTFDEVLAFNQILISLNYRNFSGVNTFNISDIWPI